MLTSRNITGAVGTAKRSGVMIAFTAPVKLASIDAIHVFSVTAPQLQTGGNGYACRCPIIGQVFAVKPVITGNLIKSGQIVTGVTEADAIAFVFDPAFEKVLQGTTFTDLAIRLQGDFALDTGSPARAIDAEFVRAEFPTGNGPSGSPYGIQGGAFESWLIPVKQG